MRSISLNLIFRLIQEYKSGLADHKSKGGGGTANRTLQRYARAEERTHEAGMIITSRLGGQ